MVHSFPAGGQCSKESDVDDKERGGNREGETDVNTGAGQASALETASGLVLRDAVAWVVEVEAQEVC